MVPTDSSIPIIGAGPTGALAALALAEQGCFVVLTDVQSAGALQGRSRAYAITHSSRRLLQRLNLWEPLASDLVAFQQLDLRDQAIHRRTLFGLGDLPKDNRAHDAIGWILDHRPLMALLLDRLKHHANVDLQLGVQSSASTGGPSPSLVVAADGPRSQTRASWGIGTWRIPYRQGCLTAKVILRGTVPGTAYELFRPEGPLAVLPLGGETYQVVWSAPFSRCQQRAELPVGNSSTNWRCAPPGRPDLLLDRPGAFAQEWMLARRFRRGAGVLIGEAAHRCHPVGGQGLNLCWRDVEALVDAVRVGLPSQRTAARYSRRRRADVLLVGLATDALVRLFSNRSPVLLPLRWLGLQALSRVGVLRRLSLRAMTDGPLQLARVASD